MASTPSKLQCLQCRWCRQKGNENDDDDVHVSTSSTSKCWLYWHREIITIMLIKTKYRIKIVNITMLTISMQQRELEMNGIKGIRFCWNKGSYPFPRAANYEIGKIHWYWQNFHKKNQIHFNKTRLVWRGPRFLQIKE